MYYSITKKKEEISEKLVDIFDRINIQTPSNFDKILDFVFDHVKKNAGLLKWKTSDVEFAFKEWIESKQ